MDEAAAVDEAVETTVDEATEAAVDEAAKAAVDEAAAVVDWSYFLEAAVEAEEEWWQQQVTEMAEQDVEQWVQDTEAKAAAMEAALDGYGQHGCGEVVVLGDAEAATEAEVETTEAEAEAEGGQWQSK